jgi:hypothetical protein
MAFPNIMSLFQGTPASIASTVPQQPTGVANPGQPLPGTQGTPGTAPNGVVPAQLTNPNAGGNPGNSDASPLAAFSDIWQTNPNAADPTIAGMFANVDPAKLQESARKVNFTSAVTPENLTAIAGGGEAAVKAFQESMNLVAQNVYAQSALATTKIVEQALGRAQETYDARIPGMLKRLSSTESLQAENEMLKHPAVQPLVGALQHQLLQKNPNASTAELNQQIIDYFAQVGLSFAPKAAAPSGPHGQRRVEEDWSSFLG